jgi:hypothetical protein
VPGRVEQPPAADDLDRSRARHARLRITPDLRSGWRAWRRSAEPAPLRPARASVSGHSC